ncbi:hypothetical protein K474DRAFT_1657175 [Panus rudis PR-1116 ss-1]|nr:hypothetical protein K474DRAFT_1657175 [Panus rudis PR-1116 ss-1]
MASPSSQSTEWLQERLVEILNSPHISFKKPAGLTNIRMGPGPIDLFSTRFANTVTSDVKGTVAGKEVDKEGLKEALLALQKKWNADSVLFKPQTSTGVYLACDCVRVGPKEFNECCRVREEGGAPRISELSLDGDEDLFT